MCANVSRLIYCLACYSQLPSAPSTSARTASGDLPDITHICIAPNSITRMQRYTKEWLLCILPWLENYGRNGGNIFIHLTLIKIEEILYHKFCKVLSVLSLRFNYCYLCVFYIPKFQLMGFP